MPKSTTNLLKQGKVLTDKQEEMKEKARLLGQKILEAREKKGWSQERLGEAVGISQPAIKDIEDGKTLRSRYLDDILSIFGIAGEGKTPPHPIPPAMKDWRLPIYGTRESESGLLMLSENHVDDAPMPERLASVPGAYGVYMSGASMLPRYRDGDLLLIHPHLSPRPGDGVAVFSIDKKTTQIFEFVKATATEWVLLRYKDAGAEHKLARTLWPKIEVIYGVYSRT